MLNSNDRLHFKQQAKITKMLRYLARSDIRAEDKNAFSEERPCEVVVTIYSPTRRRLDPPNFYPTIKALIDGYTDGELWKDDNYKIIRRLSFVYGGISEIKGVLVLAGCREADKVSYNVSKEADNFNEYSALIPLLTRTDKIEFKVEGLLSVDTSDKEKITIIAETSKGKYKKHFVNLTGNNMYVVEDISKGKDVSKYKYEVEYMPESIVPVTVTNNED
ncbi:unnamed protein product [Cylicocyclus nassatus]|uniref:Uncharacterized protein n=1 Tax=Cylicocyclus nassatus TaxID=53992 RepID=A0AA36GQQ3_CYLNA|nr:unnamed protein product [Cylicocyclus nassatus]